MTTIFKMLDVSTVHISHLTAVELEHNKLNSTLMVQKWYEDGWIIAVPASDGASITTLALRGHRGLAALLARAQELECDYVKLDADGEVIDGLETYAW